VPLHLDVIVQNEEEVLLTLIDQPIAERCVLMTHSVITTSKLFSIPSIFLLLSKRNQVVAESRREFSPRTLAVKN
jgi:hypothetical protein